MEAGTIDRIGENEYEVNDGKCEKDQKKTGKSFTRCKLDGR